MGWDYDLTLSSAPATEPVTVNDARKHCRIFTNDEDGMIEGWIVAARRYCESYLDRQLVSATWLLKFSEFPEVIYVPRPPLVSVTSISYVDTAGAAQTLSASAYEVKTPTKAQGRIELADGYSWPSIRSATVTYVAGYGSASAVPQTIKHAIYMLVAGWCEHREGILQGSISKELEFGVCALLDCESWGAMV